MIKSKEITTEELVQLLEKKETRVIDVRPVDAYNGWRLQNEQRGGHISGAKSLSAKWANYIDWIEIVRSKGILPEHEIVLYGYSREEAEKVAARFAEGNYSCISTYNHFVDEWATDNKLPMDFLPRFRNLVPASWVNEIISGNTPPEIDGRKVVICHSHYRNRDAYLSGHIPGAIDMDTLALEAPETWNRRSPDELKYALEKHGITSDTCVIVYGKFMFPDNADEFPGSAAWFNAWLMGWPRVSVFDDGWFELLIGFDMKKSPEVIIKAYNDPHGHTKRFNLNHLVRLNNELDADFIPENFEHQTVYNPVSGAVKSFLISKIEQTVDIPALEQKIHFDKWEPIFMELSRKFDQRAIETIATEHGFQVEHQFTDRRNYFVNSLWVKK